MTSDPFLFRCRRCSRTLDIDVEYCSTECETAPTLPDRARAYLRNLRGLVALLRFMSGR